MIPPVSSPPSAVKSQPSSGPTLVKPRKIQVGTETMSPASAHDLAVVAIGTPAELPLALEAQEHFRREVDVQVVGDAVAASRPRRC